MRRLSTGDDNYDMWWMAGGVEKTSVFWRKIISYSMNSRSF